MPAPRSIARQVGKQKPAPVPPAVPPRDNLLQARQEIARIEAEQVEADRMRDLARQDRPSKRERRVPRAFVQRDPHSGLRDFVEDGRVPGLRGAADPQARPGREFVEGRPSPRRPAREVELHDDRHGRVYVPEGSWRLGMADDLRGFVYPDR